MMQDDTFDEGKAAVRDIASNLREGAHNASKAAAETVRRTADAAKETAGKVKDAAVDSATEFRKRTADAVSEGWGKTNEALGQMGEAASETVRRYPFASIAAVGVIGLLLGALLSSRR